MVRPAPSSESCYDLSNSRRSSFADDIEEGDLSELEEDTLPGGSSFGGGCGAGSLRKRTRPDIDPRASNPHPNSRADKHSGAYEHPRTCANARSHCNAGSLSHSEP